MTPNAQHVDVSWSVTSASTSLDSSATSDRKTAGSCLICKITLIDSSEDLDDPQRTARRRLVERDVREHLAGQLGHFRSEDGGELLDMQNYFNRFKRGSR